MSICHRTYTAHEEIKNVLDEINHLDSLLADEPDLISRKAALLKRLNLIQPPIGRLPREILSGIFETFSSPTHPTYTHMREFAPVREKCQTPFILGAVSSLWHDVVFSTPSLWTHFRGETHRKGHPSVLRHYLKNSGVLPIHLELEFITDVPLNSLFHPSVDEELIRSMPRIRALRLSQPPVIWSTYMDRLSALVDLDLHYRTRGQGDPDLLPGQCDRLRRLSLVFTEPSNFGKTLRHETSYLTALCLFGVCFDTAFKAIGSCPNLVELSLVHLLPPRDDSGRLEDMSWRKDSMLFRCLEVFDWFLLNSKQWGAQDAMNFFLNELQTPALRTLVLRSQPVYEYQLSAAEMQFLNRHAKTISTLRLQFFERPPAREIYRILFTQDSVVENLIFESYGNMIEVIADLAAILTVGTSGETQAGTPGLKSLVLLCNFYCTPRESASAQLESLLLVLEKRLANETACCIKLPSRGLPGWTREEQERLRNWVKKGIKLEIMEDGKAVDWLGDSSG